MANMPISVLTVSYKADASLVALAKQFVAVVAGAEDGGVAAPGAQNAAGFMGVAQTIPGAALAPVSVMKIGISQMIGKGTIAFGDAVAIYSASGDVYSVQAALQAGPGSAKVWNVIGVAESSVTVDGDFVNVFIGADTVPVAVS